MKIIVYEKRQLKLPNTNVILVIFSKNEDNVQKMSTLLCTKLPGPLRYVLNWHSMGNFICDLSKIFSWKFLIICTTCKLSQYHENKCISKNVMVRQFKMDFLTSRILFVWSKQLLISCNVIIDMFTPIWHDNLMRS